MSSTSDADAASASDPVLASDADPGTHPDADPNSDPAPAPRSEPSGLPVPAPHRDPVAPRRLDPPDLARIMGLTPHSEGGWYRETWRTGVRVTPPGYPGPRETASGIYFLLGPGEESVWHVVESAELWLWHRGGPLELRLGGDGTTPAAEPHRILLGPDVEAGEQPQVLVPPGVWQAARPAAGREVLVSCVVSPAFSFEDFRTL